MTARHILAEVYAWVAEKPEGVRPYEIDHYLCSRNGRRPGSKMGSFLATMEKNGFYLTEDQGRIYAMDGLIMQSDGAGRATVYYQGDPIGTVRRQPGLAHEPREWRAYNLRGEYVGKAYSGKQAAKLLAPGRSRSWAASGRTRRKEREQMADKFEQWCIVELFGHNIMAGLVSEQVIGGQSFVRVDVPATEQQPAFTKFFGSGAIYAMTPTDEATARAAVMGLRQKPIETYKLNLPQLQAPSRSDENDLDEDWLRMEAERDRERNEEEYEDEDPDF